MSIALSEEHAELSSTLRKWAESLGGLEAVRAAETEPAATFADVWSAVSEMGLPAIALPESVGGGGGRVLDAAIALEAAASALVPGPVLSTSVAAVLLGEQGAVIADGASVGLGLAPTLELSTSTLHGTVEVVWDAVGADHLLLGAEGRWFLVPSGHAEIEPRLGPDLTRRFGTVRVDVPLTDVTELTGVTTEAVRRVAVTLAAAEASGIARWCLATAVDYAKTREQFGAKIGSFQAIKQLMAETLETAEAITAVAWDAASAADEDAEQWAFAVDAAGVVAFEGVVSVAQECIQVLGGIGFTFEHDAHLYLRRAMSLRSLLGSSDDFAAALTERAVDGVRRKVRVELPEDDGFRASVHETVAAIANRPADGQRDGLVDAGYLAPHWPTPYGLDATPAQQLVIDQELAAAGVTRPDLKIGAWAVPTILSHGTDEQRGRFVDQTLRGEIIWCQLFSEPEAGSDLASLRTRAVRVDGGWKLTGQKVWTSLAAQAHWGICLARTDADAPQHKGITYFLLDMSSPGIDIRPLREMTGDALFNEVFLDEVFVPDDCVVGEVNGGWRLAVGTLANERVAMAGSKLDLSVERAIALAADASAIERVRIGHAIALSTVCGLLGMRATLRSLAGLAPGAESSVAKLLTVRNRQDASDLVVQLTGPRAVLGGEDVRGALHEALLTRCLSIAGGTTQILRNVAAERILGLPR